LWNLSSQGRMKNDVISALLVSVSAMRGEERKERGGTTAMMTTTRWRPNSELGDGQLESLLLLSLPLLDAAAATDSGERRTSSEMRVVSLRKFLPRGRAKESYYASGRRRESEEKEEKGEREKRGKKGGGGAFFSPLFFLSLREFEPFPRALSSPSASSSHRQLFLTSNARTAPPGLRHERAATAALGLPRGGQGEREGIGGGEGNGRRQCAACLFCLSPRRCCCSRFFDSCALRSSRSWCLLGARRPARQARRDQAKANWGRSSTSGDECRHRACKCSFFPPRRRPTEPFLRSEAAFRRGLVPGRRSRSSRNQRRRDDCQCR